MGKFAFTEAHGEGCAGAVETAGEKLEGVASVGRGGAGVRVFGLGADDGAVGEADAPGDGLSGDGEDGGETGGLADLEDVKEGDGAEFARHDGGGGENRGGGRRSGRVRKPGRGGGGDVREAVPEESGLAGGLEVGAILAGETKGGLEGRRVTGMAGGGLREEVEGAGEAVAGEEGGGFEDAGEVVGVHAHLRGCGWGEAAGDGRVLARPSEGGDEILQGDMGQIEETPGAGDAAQDGFGGGEAFKEFARAFFPQSLAEGLRDGAGDRRAAFGHFLGSSDRGVPELFGDDETAHFQDVGQKQFLGDKRFEGGERLGVGGVHGAFV